MRLPWILLAVAACTSAPAIEPDAAVVTVDASLDAPPSGDKAAPCASTFGNVLTNSFGRVDGTVLAVVPPNLQTCAQPNSTHLVLQVTVNGAAYRMVINVDVLTHEIGAPLAGSAWAEGWHPAEQLDYVTTLHVASPAFVAHTTAENVASISDALTLGAKVSVYSTSSGGTKADSSHLIHRNAANKDGAIVIGPDTATPRYLLFRFSNQTF